MNNNDIQLEETFGQGDESEEAWQEDKRIRHRVEVQALQIERFLARHDIKAEVDGGSVHSDWIDFNLRSQLSEGWQRLSKMTNGLVGALGVPDVRLSRKNGNLRLMVQRDAAHPVDLLDLLAAAPRVNGGEVILGVDDEGRPVILDLFTNEMSHILVTGVSGAGKSGLLRSIAVSLAISSRQSDIQLCIISAGSNATGIFSRSNQLLPLSFLPHLQFPVTQDIDDAADALSFIADEILYRDETELDTPKLVVLIDDADLLIAKGGQRILRPLMELIEAPENTGLRLIVAAAEPNQAPISQLMRFGAQLRLVGRVSDADHAFLYTGEDSSGAEHLNGRGDFLAVSYGKIIRFQSAFIDDYDLHLTISELHRSSRNILIATQKENTSTRKSIVEKKSARVFTVGSEDGRVSFTSEQASPAEIINGQTIEPVVTNDMSLVLVEEEEALIFHDEDKKVGEQNIEDVPSAPEIDDDDNHQSIKPKPNRPPITVTKTSDEIPGRSLNHQAAKAGGDEDFSVQSLPLEFEYSDIHDEHWNSSEELEERSDDINRYH